MRMCKKAISLLLMICLCPISIFASSADMVQHPSPEAMRVLSSLEIIKGDEDGTFKPDANITRAEFVSMVIKIMNLDHIDEIGSISQYFTDVPADHSSASYIALAAKLKIISGTGDKLFRPDENITYSQAVVILVNALGYGMIARQSGGTEFNYLIQAKDIGLANGVDFKGSDDAQRGIVIQMLYNALLADLLQENSFGDKVNYQSLKDHNLLTERFELTKVKGVVNAVWKTKLAGISRLKADEIEIDGELYKFKSDHPIDYFGLAVTAYYKSEDNGDKTVVVILPDNNKNNITSIDADSIEQYQEGVLSYWIDKEEDDKASEIKIASSADLILNGQFYSGYPEEILREGYGSAKTIDNTGDDIADVVIVTAYDTIVVDSVDVKDHLILDKLTLGNSLRLDPEDKDIAVKIFREDKEIGIEDLKDGDVLSIEKSGNDILQIINIYVSDSKLSGVIQEMEKEKIRVDDTEYKMTPGLIDKLKVGEEYNFYLNVDRKIVYFDKIDSNTQNTGFVIKYNIKEGVSRDLQLRIFTKENEIRNFECCDKVVIDGIQKETSADIVSALLENNGSINQVIDFFTNEEGKIKSIDTPEQKPEEGEYTLRQVYSTNGAKLAYSSGAKSFEGKQNIGTDTIAFLIPQDMNDTKSYEVKNSATLETDQKYSFEAYSKHPDRILPDVLVMIFSPADIGVGNNTGITLVDKVTVSKNEEGETTKKLYGLKDGVEIQAVAKDPGLLEGVNQGDTIRFETNNREEIINVYKVYDAATDQLKDTKNPVGIYSDTYYQVVGYVYSKQNNIIKVTLNMNDVSNTDYNNFRYYVTDKFKIQVYDRSKKNNKVYIGTVDDLLAYDRIGSRCSKVIVYTKYFAAKTINIYKY